MGEWLTSHPRTGYSPGKGRCYQLPGGEPGETGCRSGEGRSHAEEDPLGSRRMAAAPGPGRELDGRDVVSDPDRGGANAPGASLPGSASCTAGRVAPGAGRPAPRRLAHLPDRRDRLFALATRLALARGGS